MPADLVFVNGDVYTVDAARSWANAVAVDDGAIVAVGTEGDEALAALSDVFLPIPDVPEVVQPLLAVVPLQLLAYRIARLRGLNVDQPRNLAKTVTVE